MYLKAKYVLEGQLMLFHSLFTPPSTIPFFVGEKKNKLPELTQENENQGVACQETGLTSGSSFLTSKTTVHRRDASFT